MASPSPDEIEAQRAPIHGPHKRGHASLGRAWGALLTEYLQADVPDLPAHVVELMLVELKVQRAVRPMVYSPDDYDDAFNYLKFAAKDCPREPAP